ncbi:unnamed protein product [Ilex paraguariensis]|uniref:Cytochrome P450 n=1 Tax=Ilex paraguariensis TaxID=185542 RepID=A0ABC8QWL0_9AQUA
MVLVIKTTMNPTTLATGDTNLFFPLLLLLLLSLITFKLFSTKRSSLPPGPFSWPIVGNLFQIGKNPHINLAKLAQTHGPLMSLRFGSRLVIVGSSREVAAEILKTHDRLLSGRCIPDPLKVKDSKLHNLGIGFFDECDNNWKNVKSMYKGVLFSAKAMDSQVSLREKKVMEMVRYLATKEGQVVNLKEIVFTTAFNILSNILLSVDLTDFEESEGEEEGLKVWLRKYVEVAGTPQLADLYPVFAGWDLQGMCKRMMKLFDKICDSWINIVKQKRERGIQILGQGDFTDALIEKGFSDDQINAIFMVSLYLSPVYPYKCMHLLV